MLVPAVAFSDFVLAVHILAVVVGYGVAFAYPLFVAVGARLDRRSMPWFHRMQQVISRRLTNPALAVILLAGIYLASDLHQWKNFYVQWGIGAVVVLGALEGSFMIRSTGKLAELAERDLAAAAAAAAAGAGADSASGGGSDSASGEVSWSGEYEALAKRVGAVGTLMSLIVIVTVFLMATHAGAGNAP